MELISGPTPITREHRIVSLDILRGAAVLGILLINIFIFGKADDPAFWEDLNKQASGPDFWLRIIITGLFQGKMRALFCMLFGAGIMLFDEQKRKAKGRSPWGLFYNRMFWLVLFGLVHAYLLLFKGDILFFYGVFGMLVFLLRNLKPVLKAIAVLVIILTGMAMNQYLYQDYRGKYLEYLDVQEKQQQGVLLSSQDSRTLESWEVIRRGNNPEPDKIAERKALMLGTYKDVASVIRPEVSKHEIRNLPTSLIDNVSLMLLGMVLLQWGFFRGTWRYRQYLLMLFIGYAIGLPLMIYSKWIAVNERSSFEMVLVYMNLNSVDWQILIYQIQRLLLSLAHVSLLMIIIKRNLLGWLLNALRAIGQMAFTNYILQTVICTLIFFGYGLGYYDSFRIYQLYLLTLGIWIFEMIFSSVWLKYFRFGPLEWLWRSLTYVRIQPIFRKMK